MAYTKTNWTEGVTALGPANYNNMEQGIADAHAMSLPSVTNNLSDLTKYAGTANCGDSASGGWRNATMYTAMNLSGAGRLLGFRVLRHVNDTSTWAISVSVDGAAAVEVMGVYSQGSGSTPNTSQVELPPIQFHTSLLVKIGQRSGQADAGGGYAGFIGWVKTGVN